MVNAEGCRRGCWIKEGGRGPPPTKAPDGKTVPPASHTLDKNILSAAVDGHQLSVGCGGAWGLGLLGPRGGERGEQGPRVQDPGLPQ